MNQGCKWEEIINVYKQIWCIDVCM
jgi:hypothetical protein